MDNLRLYFLNPAFVDLGVQLSVSYLGIQESKTYIDKTLTEFLTGGINVQYLGFLLLKETNPNNYEQEFFEEVQEDICKFCEIEILGCSRSSYHYQCEGSRCDEAQEMYLEEIEDQFEKPLK